MRKFFCVGWLWVALPFPFLAAGPVRLALIPGNATVAPAIDILTVELSKLPGVELLERAQIDKVYREQATAASGTDAVKLGQILGADGVLVLELAQENGARLLNARLAAVKPGVILRHRQYPWPLENLPEWSAVASGQFQPLLPKLAVLPKDALPLSVLNLRSAVRSSEGEALERELTLLLHNRLSQERELFLLERRRLGWLAEEKELKAEPSAAFWNGSYLLEGTIDRQGFSRDMATVNARLSPPNGGQPTEIEVTGPRSNLVATTEALVGKILQALRRNSSAPEWKPADEAAKYLEEARWALRWKMYLEAQAAADSAWALGRQDMDCASARVKAYVAVVPPETGGYVHGESHNSTGDPKITARTLAELKAEHPVRLAYVQRGNTIEYTSVGKMPDPKAIDRALYALSLYDDFSRTLPANEPIAWSPWHLLGIETVEAASKVLEHFHFVPASRRPLEEKLAELRALVRTVAAWLARSPSVQNSYAVGDGEVNPEEVRQLVSRPSIYGCQVDWGCLWQETPEDTVEMYGQLMQSAAFAYLNKQLWFRPMERPRLAAWKAGDEASNPVVWKKFLHGLAASSNALVRLEGRFLEMADAPSATKSLPALEELMNAILSSRGGIVSNTVDVLYLGWNFHDLGSHVLKSIGETPEGQQMRQRLAEFHAKLQAIQDEHRASSSLRVAEKKASGAFESQRRFLMNFEPLTSRSYSSTFNGPPWSKTQAAELLALLARYRSNMVAQSVPQPESDTSRDKLTTARMRSLESRLNLALGVPRNRPPPTNQQQAMVAPINRPAPPVQRESGVPEVVNPFIASTNVLVVSHYSKFPIDRFTEDLPPVFKALNCSVYAQRWREGRLWLDCRYTFAVFVNGYHPHQGAFLAWNPGKEDWTIIRHPEEDESSWETAFGERDRITFEVFRDALYVSERKGMRKFDLRTRRWERLKFQGQQLAQIFVVNQRLYAANSESIYEMLEGGQSTRVLASCRRKPAASTLDSLETLGSPVLFPGPRGTVRAVINGQLFTWEQNDWHKTSNTSLAKLVTGEVFDRYTLLRSPSHLETLEVQLLPHTEEDPELCWAEQRKAPYGSRSVPRFIRGAPPVPQPDLGGRVPKWTTLPGANFALAPAVIDGSNILFLVDHSGVTNLSTGLAMTEKDGRHAHLVCLERASSMPFAVPLKFDLTRGSLGTKQIGFGLREGIWLVQTPAALLIGQSSPPGIWSIPRNELEAALRRNRPRANARGELLPAE